VGRIVCSKRRQFQVKLGFLPVILCYSNNYPLDGGSKNNQKITIFLIFFLDKVAVRVIFIIDERILVS
jgi:hypothetical protein